MKVVDNGSEDFTTSSKTPEEYLADWMMENISALHRWMFTGWRETMYDEAVDLAKEMLRASEKSSRYP